MRYIYAIFGLALLLLALVPAPAAASPTSSPDLQQYQKWIREARALYPYRESTAKMYRVMLCESSGNPRAVGGGGRWFGLYQYVPSTWRGAWNPYRRADLFDAKAQIFATARAWSIGKQHEWSCYFLTR